MAHSSHFLLASVQTSNFIAHAIQNNNTHPSTPYLAIPYSLIQFPPNISVIIQHITYLLVYFPCNWFADFTRAAVWYVCLKLYLQNLENSTWIIVGPQQMIGWIMTIAGLWQFSRITSLRMASE